MRRFRKSCSHEPCHARGMIRNWISLPHPKKMGGFEAGPIRDLLDGQADGRNPVCFPASSCPLPIYLGDKLSRSRTF